MRLPAGAERVASPTLHATVFFTIGVFAMTLILSFVFKVEVVARGQGRVVPISRVQVVQPEFSGRISAIHVQNGMSVSKGDLLIELDPTEARAELGKVRSEQDRLTIESARLDAFLSVLAQGAESPDLFAFGISAFAPPSAFLRHPSTAAQRRLLEAELEDLLASFAQIDARAAANRKSEAVTLANIDRVTAALKIQAERLSTAGQLQQQGNTSRAAVRDAQQLFTDLEQQRAVYAAELDQKGAERLALDSERRSIVAKWRNTLQARKAEIEARMATLGEEERTAVRRVAATVLTAPSSGVVDRLSVFTIGGIAEAGAELLRVVPTDIAVEMEGAFSNQDIGFILKEQPANIRLDAFPSERFGTLKGHVTDIAADSVEISEGQWVYIVRVAPDQAFLKAGEDRFPLRPGMTASIDITTEKRRIISYFFAPILRTVQGAMGER